MLHPVSLYRYIDIHLADNTNGLIYSLMPVASHEPMAYAPLIDLNWPP